MEKKQNNALILNSVIILADLVLELLNLPYLEALPDGGLVCVSHLFICLLIIWYASYAYRKPHGNMLKHLMLLFSVSLFPTVRLSVIMSNPLEFTVLLFAVTSVSYMAGRLDKIGKNRFIAVWVFLLLLIAAVSDISLMPEGSSFLSYVRLFSNAALWLAICLAYFTRFLAHKEAGLTDPIRKVK